MDGSFGLRLLFRGTRDGMTNDKFHELCDNQGPLLAIIKTNKDILIGGFCSISYKNDNSYWNNVDPKVVVFSITRNKVYHRLTDDADDVFFGTDNSFTVGFNAISIHNNKLCCYANCDPFQIPSNGAGEQEMAE
jgi:hypothetical protein